MHQALKKECMSLRDELCVREWNQAEAYLGQGVLPDCELLQDQPDECIDSADLAGSSGSSSALNQSPTSFLDSAADNSITTVTMDCTNNTTISSVSSEQTTNCSMGFFLNNGICRPECVEWINPNFLRTATIEKIVTIATSTVALISCTTIIIITLTVQRESLLRFPSIYHFYIALSIFPSGLFSLLGFTDKKALFCANKDLLDTFQHETTFCTLSGMVYFYTLLQSSMWLAFHAVILCWGIMRPFQYRRFKNEGKLKWIHITTVILTIVLPLISILVLLKDGYTITYSRPVFCVGRNQHHTFFTVVLPICFLSATCTSALILLFWMILKVLFFKKISKQKRGIGKIGKAEVKIMLTVCFYIPLGVTALAVSTYWDATNHSQLQAYRDYFLCESAGSEYSNECNNLLSSPTIQLPNQLYIVAVALQGLLPFVVLLFSMNVKEWKKKQ